MCSFLRIGSFIEEILNGKLVFLCSVKVFTCVYLHTLLQALHEETADVFEFMGNYTSDVLQIFSTRIEY